MLIARQFTTPSEQADRAAIIVALPYDLRKKSRLRTRTRCGREIGIQLPRGTELRQGDRLLADSGEVIAITASPETVSTVTGDDPLLLLKAAYHLGNRHVPLEVTTSWLRYQHDHVLDNMVAGLGLRVTVEDAPFQPESGAYHHHGAAAHRHGAGGDHNHHHHDDHHSHLHDDHVS